MLQTDIEYYTHLDRCAINDGTCVYLSICTCLTFNNEKKMYDLTQSSDVVHLIIAYMLPFKVLHYHTLCQMMLDCIL